MNEREINERDKNGGIGRTEEGKRKLKKNEKVGKKEEEAKERRMNVRKEMIKEGRRSRKEKR